VSPCTFIGSLNDGKGFLRIHRIHTDQSLEPEAEILLQGAPAHYLTRVLRVVPGQSVVLFNGDGVLGRVPARPESPLRITLVQALSRGERLDQTLQKSTELGMATFQPLISERVEVRFKPDRQDKRMEHWRNVVISACEQCGRAFIPAVYEPLSLGEWLGLDRQGPRLVLEPGADSALTRISLEDKVSLLVGPEGGFSDSELALMRLHDVQAASLGPRILRTETAGLAAIAILQALAGDFR